MVGLTLTAGERIGRLMRTGTFLSLSVLLALLAACASPGQNRDEKPPTIYSDDNIEIVATLISVNELNRKYSNPNPFVAPNLFLTRFELLTFELDISASVVPLRIERNQIRIDFEGGRTAPQSKSELRDIWEQFTVDDDVSTIETSRGRAYIQHDLLSDREDIINRGAALRGLIVFRGSFPNDGVVVITIPYSSDAAKATATLQLELSTTEITSPLCIFCP